MRALNLVWLSLVWRDRQPLDAGMMLRLYRGSLDQVNACVGNVLPLLPFPHCYFHIREGVEMLIGRHFLSPLKQHLDLGFCSHILNSQRSRVFRG